MAKRLEIKGAFGGSGVSSWNDLTDKPFYEEGGIIDIVWDGDPTGRDSASNDTATFCKVGDMLPALDDLIGTVAKVSQSYPGDDSITEFDGGLGIGEGAVLVAYDTTVVINDTLSISVPSTGVYFLLHEELNTKEYISNLAYNDVIIAWDGDINKREVCFIDDTPMYKVSDLTPTADELSTRSLKLSAEIMLTYDLMSEEYQGSLVLADGQIGVIVYDTKAVEADIGIVYPSTGVYFLYDENCPRSYTLSYDGTVIHSLDPKFLPEDGFGWKESEQVTIEWDGITDDLPTVVVEGTDVALYKISDLTPVEKDFYGSTQYFSDGTSSNVSAEDIQSMDGLYMAGALYVATSLVVEDGGLSITFPGTGIYVMKQGDAFFISTTIDATIFHHVSEKFIPDTIARTKDILTLDDIPISDWAENDSSAHGHIENRTHWAVRDDILLIPNCTLDVSYGGSSGIWHGYGVYSTSMHIYMEEGESYTVTFERNSYVCVCQKYEEVNNGITWTNWLLGNTDFMPSFGLTNNYPNLPFLLRVDKLSNSSGCDWNVYLSDPRTISIEMCKGVKTFYPLDQMYIPDTIARTADISKLTNTLPFPAVASVGQFIMVSEVDENGKIIATEAVDAPSSSTVPAMFTSKATGVLQEG